MITALVILSLVSIFTSLFIGLILYEQIETGNNLMATLSEKLAEVQVVLNDGLALVSLQIAAVETQVEALYALIVAGALTPEQEAELENLKTSISAGFETLRSGVEQIAVDDPNS